MRPFDFASIFLRSTDLQSNDIRYSGLTPTQYGSIILLIAGTILFLRRKKEDTYKFIES